MTRPQVIIRGLLAGLILVGVTACVPRYKLDGPPTQRLDVSLIQPVTPRPEPLSAYGNHSPYEVMGQRYEVLDSAHGYLERGIASWYGTAFHGRRTSSGEPYDLYQLTAAHKSLPLPSYVEVTHLETGRSIVVRVNDRGPFKPGRIIDLSWAAAVKLGMDQQGTAPVEVRALTFNEGPMRPKRPARLPVWVQAGAFSQEENARRLHQTLSGGGLGPLVFEPPTAQLDTLWRVRLGPFEDLETAVNMVERLLELGLDQAQYVYP